MINGEKLNFSVKFLSNVFLVIVVSAPEGDKSISFDHWGSLDLESGHLHLLGLVEEIVYVCSRFGLARIGLFSSGKRGMRINCNLIREFVLGGFSNFFIWSQIRESIAASAPVRNITDLRRQSSLLILSFNLVEVETRDSGEHLLSALLFL